jgi:hypothetical protein
MVTRGNARSSWLSLDSARRDELRRWHPTTEVTSGEARIAVVYGRRRWRQTLWSWLVVAVILFGGMFLSGIAAPANRSAWAGLAILLAIAVFIATLIPGARYRRVQTRYMTAALKTDILVPPSELIMHWRYPRLVRLTVATVLSVVRFGAILVPDG